MSENITYLHGITTQDIPIERVLEGAKEHLTGGVVAGWDKNDEFYLASNTSDIAQLVLILEIAKKQLLDIQLAANFTEGTDL